MKVYLPDDLEINTTTGEVATGEYSARGRA